MSLILILPDFSDAAWARDIRIDHLLHHTSGLPSLSPIEADKIKEVGKSFAKSVFDLLKVKPLIDIPGHRFHYSNEGYWLLGFIIEHITQCSLSLYLKENFFDLADMSSTFLMDDSDTIRSLTNSYPQLSLPMECSSDGIIHDIDPFLCEGWAAGSIVSTADDLCRWSKALFRDKSILDDAMLSYMTTPTILGQGCGLVIETLLGGGHMYKHGGAVSGYHGLFEYIPSFELCIVVLTNLDYANVTRMEALSLGILEAFVRIQNKNSLNSV